MTFGNPVLAYYRMGKGILAEFVVILYNINEPHLHFNYTHERNGHLGQVPP